MSYSPEDIRELFPICNSAIYLNNAGVAPTSTLVEKASQEWLADLVANGIHEGSQWEIKSAQIRNATANLIGAGEHEIAFIRNTSHGLALVAEGLTWKPGDEIAVCTSVEYPSNIYVWENLERHGVQLVQIPCAEEGVTEEAVRSVLTSNTRLVAVSAVQYATGHKTDLKALGNLCKETNTLLCVDGIQIIGSSPVNVKELGIHFLSADSHKWMLGMMGIGLLFVDESVLPAIRPTLVGWKSTVDGFNFDQALFELRNDASKFEEGSPNYVGIYGMGAAIEMLQRVGLGQIESHIESLLNYTEEELLSLGCKVSPPPTHRAGILMVEPPKGNPRNLYDHLTAQTIRVSLRRGRIRISPHIYNSRQDMEKLVSEIGNYLQALP
jgi:selenocysteine lyase/cysteine desulfurase